MFAHKEPNPAVAYIIDVTKNPFYFDESTSTSPLRRRLPVNRHEFDGKALQSGQGRE